ncbi:MAG: peptidase, partial [Deltaproteobacteria bacterium]
GKKVDIKVIRNQKELTFQVKIAKRTEEKEAEAVTGAEGETDLGMRVSPLTPELARQYNIPQRQGVVVVHVEKDSPADRAEVQQGDLILEINHKAIRTVKDYQAEIKKAKKGDSISLLIRRRTGFLALTITK